MVTPPAPPYTPHQLDTFVAACRSGARPDQLAVAMAASGVPRRRTRALCAAAMDLLVDELATGTAPTPRVELLSFRDPDSATDVVLVVDGRTVDDFEHVDLDPGAGYQYPEYLAVALESIRSASPAAQDVLARWWASALESKYVEGELSCRHCSRALELRDLTAPDQWSHVVDAFTRCQVPEPAEDWNEGLC